MKLFESKKLVRIAEALDTSVDLTQDTAKELAQKVEKELKKYVSPKRNLQVGVRVFMGDPSVQMLFSKYKESDGKWASGIWRNDPAIVQYSIFFEKGKCVAELIDNTRYTNHKRIIGKIPTKKTGTIDQVIAHIGKYLQEVDKKIDQYGEF